MEPKTAVVDQENDDYYAKDVQEKLLKNRISSHDLYQLLVETHIDCLKVCLGEVGDNGGIHTSYNEEEVNKYEVGSCMVNKIELDFFMESYCKVLRKFKETMEKHQIEYVGFINNMHSQLEELLDDTAASTSEQI